MAISYCSRKDHSWCQWRWLDTINLSLLAGARLRLAERHRQSPYVFSPSPWRFLESGTYLSQRWHVYALARQQLSDS